MKIQPRDLFFFCGACVALPSAPSSFPRKYHSCYHCNVSALDISVPHDAQLIHDAHAIMEIATAECIVLRREIATLYSFVDCDNRSLIKSN